MTREEAIVDIRDNIKPVVGGKSLDMAIEALEQEPKTGHWIVWNTDSYDWTYKCDKCERIALKDSNYCPNCGARMESEEI